MGRLQNDADGPHVHLVAVPVLVLQDFGRDVVRRAADGFLLLALELQFGGQAEVAQFDLHLVVQEQVAQLQTSVIKKTPGG